MQTRMVLFITLGVYLLALGMMLSAISITVPSIEFESSTQNLPQTDYQWNLPNNIKLLPVWINVLFILVPFIAWIIVLVTLFFPTGNAGS
jgi:hypothetical protein